MEHSLDHCHVDSEQLEVMTTITVPARFRTQKIAVLSLKIEFDRLEG